MKKIRKSYRLNIFVTDMLNNIKEKLGISETSFVEMSVIEKYQKIDRGGIKKEKALIILDDMISSLEQAKNRLK